MNMYFYVIASPQLTKEALMYASLQQKADIMFILHIYVYVAYYTPYFIYMWHIMHHTSAICDTLCTILHLYVAHYAPYFIYMWHIMHHTSSICGTLCTILHLYVAHYAPYFSYMWHIMHHTSSICDTLCTVLHHTSVIHHTL